MENSVSMERGEHWKLEAGDSEPKIPAKNSFKGAIYQTKVDNRYDGNLS